MKLNVEALLTTAVAVLSGKEIWRFWAAKQKAKERKDESLNKEMTMYRSDMIKTIQNQSKDIIQRDKKETELLEKITNLSSALARLEEANKHLEKDLQRHVKNNETNKQYIEQLLKDKK